MEGHCRAIAFSRRGGGELAGRGRQTLNPPTVGPPGLQEARLMASDDFETGKNPKPLCELLRGSQTQVK